MIECFYLLFTGKLDSSLHRAHDYGPDASLLHAEHAHTPGPLGSSSGENQAQHHSLYGYDDDHYKEPYFKDTLKDRQAQVAVGGVDRLHS